MVLPDVNVLVYAYRADTPRHALYRDWLLGTVDADAAFAMSDLVLSGFLRVVTHRRVFDPPSPIEHALGFVDALRGHPACVPVAPANRHWDIFSRLCHGADARGNLIADAYLAALAIEHGCEWITTDRDFSRFQGLRWRHPLDT